jgi:hypothetical protein
MDILLACGQLCCRCPLGHVCGIIALFVWTLRLTLAKDVAPLVGRHGRDHLGSESDDCGRNAFGLQLHETRVVNSAGFGIGCFWRSLRPVLDVRESLVSRLATRLY